MTVLESGMAFVLFKALIGFGLPLAFAIRELILLNRLKREREAAERPIMAIATAAELPSDVPREPVPAAPARLPADAA